MTTLLFYLDDLMSPEPFVTFPVCRSKSINALKTSICGPQSDSLRSNMNTMVEFFLNISHYQNTMIMLNGTYLNIFLPFLESLNQPWACLLHHSEAKQLNKKAHFHYQVHCPSPVELSQVSGPHSHCSQS
jgi:hypothetical protein